MIASFFNTVVGKVTKHSQVIVAKNLSLYLQSFKSCSSLVRRTIQKQLCTGLVQNSCLLKVAKFTENIVTEPCQECLTCEFTCEFTLICLGCRGLVWTPSNILDGELYRAGALTKPLRYFPENFGNFSVQLTGF